MQIAKYVLSELNTLAMCMKYDENLEYLFIIKRDPKPFYLILDSDCSIFHSFHLILDTKNMSASTR